MHFAKNKKGARQNAIIISLGTCPIAFQFGVALRVKSPIKHFAKN